MEIRRGKKEEFYTIIDFIDFVFSKAHCPHDFLSMYANLYLETDESMHNMINIWEVDQIVGSTVSLPRTMVVGGKALKVNGIGSVACHPRFGGRGIMSTMMKYNNEEMAKDGVHLACLGGRRTRYNHFGYEVGGNHYTVEVDDEAILDRCPDYDASHYTFKPFTMEDKDILKACHDLYNAQPIHYDYNDVDFFLRLTIPSNGSVPYTIEKDGQFCGYISHNSDDDLYAVEMVLADANDSADVLISLAVQQKKSVKMDIYEYQLPLFRKIADMSEVIDYHGSGMWKVLDWPAVIEALLTFKASYMTLPEGTLVLGIDGTAYEVALQNGQATVTVSDKTPDYAFNELNAVTALTNPVPASYFGLTGDPDKLALVRSWFPLPLSRLYAERV